MIRSHVEEGFDADTVTGADTTDAMYLLQAAYGSRAVLHWTGVSAVCVCTEDDHHFSQILNYVMRLFTNIEDYIICFCCN